MWAIACFFAPVGSLEECTFACFPLIWRDLIGAIDLAFVGLNLLVAGVVNLQLLVNCSRAALRKFRCSWMNPGERIMFLWISFWSVYV